MHGAMISTLSPSLLAKSLQLHGYGQRAENGGMPQKTFGFMTIGLDRLLGKPSDKRLVLMAIALIAWSRPPPSSPPRAS
jgi:hypothetical protein